MEWFKINMPVQDSGEILGSIRSILKYTHRADTHRIACFTKVAQDGSINVFLTEEIIRGLPGILREEYNLQKCAPPSQRSDKEGSFLTYQFGHSHLL
ncbi:MAG: hypothetical protein WB779_16645 [Ignavibacteriaceae bacterium]|jgi:hypothetical protein